MLQRKYTFYVRSRSNEPLTINNSEQRLEVGMLCSVERFRQTIGRLVLRGNFDDFDCTAIYFLADVVVAHIHVLSPGIGSGWLAEKVNGRLIVFMDDNSSLQAWRWYAYPITVPILCIPVKKMAVG